MQLWDNGMLPVASRGPEQEPACNAGEFSQSTECGGYITSCFVVVMQGKNHLLLIDRSQARKTQKNIFTNNQLPWGYTFSLKICSSHDEALLEKIQESHRCVYMLL